ncbi:MAG TPA: tail fiber protein [Reyranella sp.]|nr:tail fiber protein [Reyranella sp.]
MSEPFVGQIEIYSFNFAPKYWQLCQGQTLPINQNQALFSLLGTYYGGNGVTTFMLPDLRSRVPVGMGTGAGATWQIGQTGGQETVTLNQNQGPIHSHQLIASNSTVTSNNVDTPSTSVVLGVTVGQPATLSVPIYVADSSPTATLHSSAISQTGGSQPHENRMPYLAVNFSIALQGIFPSRN